VAASLSALDHAGNILVDRVRRYEEHICDERSVVRARLGRSPRPCAGWFRPQKSAFVRYGRARSARTPSQLRSVHRGGMAR
jgi:hypothetical protein